jgi:hypothetical protein
MENQNLEEKTRKSRIIQKLKKHPWILPIFVAANIAYFPVSIAWKVWLGKVAYEYYKKYLNIEMVAAPFSEYRDGNSQISINRVERAYRSEVNLENRVPLP